VLLVKRAAVETGVDQSLKILDAQLLVLLVKSADVDTAVDQFWRIFAL